MKDRLTDEQNQEILNALNKAIGEGPWESSNFLKMLGKQLTGLRDDFLTQIGAPVQQGQDNAGVVENASVAKQVLKEVYISIYSATGTDLQSWERIIANLSKQMISRPIYENEQDVQALIKSKAKIINEAYVAIGIKEQDILPTSAERGLSDKLGNPLLMLKDNILDLGNVSRFVHQTGVYELVKNRLIKKV